MPSLERTRIAIVEDDPIMGESLMQRLSLEGCQAVWWRTGGDALTGLGNGRPDAVVCDIRLPDMSGEDLFHRALPVIGRAPVLFITAYADIDQAVRLIRAGADDYLTKPFAMTDLLERLGRLVGQRSEADASDAVLGPSASMRAIEALLRRVADIDSGVLFTGESGVGKEVAARFLHDVSRRAAAPFVAVNCAAIPAELLESEIFGHEKGAFTGAHSRHEGYAERARDGTLFLDEIGEMPPAMQVKFLRLAQERTFVRVGGEQTLPFRARLVCATNADLEARVASGQFRKDLFYRINVISVPVPALRERPEDVLPLIDHYLARFAGAFGRDVRGLTTVAQEAALAHDWPGNVRELRNRIERAVALADGPWISHTGLFPEFALPEGPEPQAGSLAEARAAAERRCIRAALERSGGRVESAAALLGISRSTLFDKVRKLGLASELNN